ncbi:protein-glutamate methylesterase/protein-glutamine glutaminase [Coralliovum pocilloporae]|uniref:protein-glutamate methylesterase/protein-glutamine glutaminase n=1 Tax=Coralliovum pocilloporae TaxID=3066369 RepID=UPI0033078D5A
MVTGTSGATAAATAQGTDSLRVMVVDDSVVIRGLIGRWLEEEQGISVVGSHRNGKLAVDDVDRCEPDVIVLDIDMPEMDGMTALPLLIQKRRNVAIIMSSTLTQRNAEISLRALSLGASDYIPKPESNSEISTSASFRRDLTAKVKTLGARRRQRLGLAQPDFGSTNAAPGRPAAPAAPASARAPAAAATLPGQSGASAAISLRPYSSVRPRVLAIGSSTGGPQALQTVLKGISATVLRSVPIVITQHMPPTFTRILGEHITKATGVEAREGEHGEQVQAGRIYIAPGGQHMLIKSIGGTPTIELNDGPPVNFCKPAVDPMFESITATYGSAILGLILTGMGHDGAQGVKMIAGAGGSVVTQDEETSVVWGMPGAAAQTGMCSAVLPLDKIATTIETVLKGGRP